MIKTLKKLNTSIVGGLIVLIAFTSLALSACSFLGMSGDNQGMNLYVPPDGQGLYESCPLVNGSPCLDRLKQMAAGGFKLVLNYDQLYGTAKQQLTYAEQAHSLGIKIIWAMNDPVFWNGTDLVNYYSDLAPTCHCSDNNGFIHYVVSLVKDLPATWGYYIGDEVPPGNHAELKKFTDLVHQIDPKHPRLFVSCGQCDQSDPPYVASLIPMVDTADVVGTDYYPVGTYDSITTTGDAAQAVQSIADQNSKQSAMVLQSFAWPEYHGHNCDPWPSCAPFPTKDQMQQMLSLTLQNSHPDLVLWYSYFDILRSDNASAHWTDLVAATHIPNLKLIRKPQL